MFHPAWYKPPLFSEIEKKLPITGKVDLSSSEDPELRAYACHQVFIESQKLTEVLEAFLRFSRNPDLSLRRWVLHTFSQFFQSHHRWLKKETVTLPWWHQEFTLSLQEQLLKEIQSNPLDENWVLLLYVRGALNDQSVIELIRKSIVQNHLSPFDWSIVIETLRGLDTKESRELIAKIAAQSPQTTRKYIHCMWALISMGEKHAPVSIDLIDTSDQTKKVFARIRCGYDTNRHEAIQVIKNKPYQQWYRDAIYFFFHELKHEAYSQEHVEKTMLSIVQ